MPPDDRTKVRKTLKYSIFDGSFYSSMVGFGESFYQAFAVFLKGTTTELGLLGSLPQLVGSISQLLSNRLIGLFGSRKRFVVMGAMLQAFMLIPIMLVFLAQELSVPLLIFFVCCYWVFGLITNPAWSSLMGDLVDEQERGSYFGRRNRIAGVVSVIAFVIGGFILQLFKTNDAALGGFLLLFSLAFLSRIISATFLWRHHEPAFIPAEEELFGFLSFLKDARSNNYGLLVLFLASMNFAVYIASPYFAIYMLHDLKFSYWTYTLVQGTSLIVKYLCMPLWGKAADKYGSRKVLTLCAFLIVPVSAIWMFSPSIPYLILVQCFSGFAWAGFELSFFNFLLEATEPARRPSMIAYYNVLNGIGIFLGAMAGSLLIAMNTYFWTGILLVFLLSGVARLAVAFLFVFRLKEVRQVERISYPDLLLDVLSVGPNMGVIHRIVAINTKRIIKPFEAPLRELEEFVREPVELVKEVALEAVDLPRTLPTARLMRETVESIERAIRIPSTKRMLAGKRRRPRPRPRRRRRGAH
jgi:MFS family permease